MGFVSLEPLVDGDAITVAIYNRIKNNFKASLPAIFTTKGDLPVASGFQALSRFAVGANGKLLVADSNQSLGVYWYDLSAAHVGSTSAQGVASGSNVKATVFNSEIFDVAGTFASNRFTATVGGLYFVSALLTIDATTGFSADEYFYAKIYVNDVYYSTFAGMAFQADPGGYQEVSGMDTVRLDPGDYVDIYVIQNSGASKSLAATGSVLYTHVTIGFVLGI